MNFLFITKYTKENIFHNGFVTAVKKDPKTAVSDISNSLRRTGVKESQSIVHRRLHEEKYTGYTRRCKPLISKKNRRQANLQKDATN